jgi:hypothetical protein
VDVVRNSVIVAGGVIKVHGFSQGCVFVAGTMVIMGDHDGSGGRDETGSVVVSRGWADLGERAQGTIVAAQKGISAVSTEGAVIVNGPLPAPQRGAPIDIRGRSVRVADLPLESHVIHPLSTKIKVTGVMHGPVKTSASQGGRVTVGPAAAILQLDGRRYVADLRQPILDEAGQPVGALANWKLQAITTSQAIFCKADAGIVLPIDAN